MTYLNITGQRWHHNAQNKDRYRRDGTHCGSATVNKLISCRLNRDYLENKVLQKHFHRAEGLPLVLFVTRARQKDVGGSVNVDLLWKCGSDRVSLWRLCSAASSPHPYGRHTAHATPGGQMRQQHPGRTCAYSTLK